MKVIVDVPDARARTFAGCSVSPHARDTPSSRDRGQPRGASRSVYSRKRTILPLPRVNTCVAP
jgi:hypothetical protein